MKQRNMCPAECGTMPALANPYHGISALSVLPLTTVPWNRRQTHLPHPFATHDPWIDDCGGHYLHRKDRHITQGSKTEKLVNEPPLPKDPRHWSRSDVANWVQHVSAIHGLPSVHLDRFLMNGKALCLMNMEMFVNRVPLGGKLLYKDFQLRLSSALYS